MARKYMVIGLGRFGRSLAKELAKLGGEVLAIDKSHALVNAVAQDVALAVAADATDPAVLEGQNAREMDCAIVAIGENFEATVLITAQLVEMGIPRVIARAMTGVQREILKKVGAHQIIMPEHQMGERLARALQLQGVVDFVQLPEGYTMTQLRVPEEFVGKTLSSLNVRQKARVLVIRIERERVRKTKDGRRLVEKEVIGIPDGSVVLEEGDELAVIGPQEAVARLGG